MSELGSEGTSSDGAPPPPPPRVVAPQSPRPASATAGDPASDTPEDSLRCVQCGYELGRSSGTRCSECGCERVGSLTAVWLRRFDRLSALSWSVLLVSVGFAAKAIAMLFGCLEQWSLTLRTPFYRVFEAAEATSLVGAVLLCWGLPALFPTARRFRGWLWGVVIAYSLAGYGQIFQMFEEWGGGFVLTTRSWAFLGAIIHFSLPILLVLTSQWMRDTIGLSVPVKPTHRELPLLVVGFAATISLVSVLFDMRDPPFIGERLMSCFQFIVQSAASAAVAIAVWSVRRPLRAWVASHFDVQRVPTIEQSTRERA